MFIKERGNAYIEILCTKKYETLTTYYFSISYVSFCDGKCHPSNVVGQKIVKIKGLNALYHFAKIWN